MFQEKVTQGFHVKTKISLYFVVRLNFFF